MGSPCMIFDDVSLRNIWYLQFQCRDTRSKRGTSHSWQHVLRRRVIRSANGGAGGDTVEA